MHAKTIRDWMRAGSRRQRDNQEQGFRRSPSPSTRRREEEQVGVRFPPQESDTEDVLSLVNGEFSGDRDKQLAVITGVPKQEGSRPVLSTH